MSCCGGKCGCGPSCTCSGCNGCETSSTVQTLVAGVAPAKMSYESSEMSYGSENDGCKCGSSCSCDPCNCK